MNEKEKRIREILEKLPRDKKLEFTTDTLEKMFMMIMEVALKEVDKSKLLKVIEEAGKKSGENFSRHITHKYKIKIESAPSGMLVMNIASFFGGAPYEILKSTEGEVIRSVRAYDFVGQSRYVSKDVDIAVRNFLRSYYHGIVNALGKEFSIEMKNNLKEGREYYITTVKHLCNKEREKTIEIPKEIRDMKREEILEKTIRYLAIIIDHLAIELYDCVGFEKTSEILRDGTYQVGIENGRKIKEMFGLEEKPGDIFLLHLISTHMMGIETELIRETEETILYKHNYCPVARLITLILDYLNILDARKRADLSFVRCEACKGHVIGLTHAISKNWEAYSPKRLTTGDPYCFFIITKQGIGKSIIQSYAAVW